METHSTDARPLPPSPQQTVGQEGGLPEKATYEIKKYYVFQLAYCVSKVPCNIAFIKTLGTADMILCTINHDEHSCRKPNQMSKMM